MKKIILLGLVFLLLFSLVNAEQGVYNTESGKCELPSSIAFVTLCREGTFRDGTCVTQPNVEYICPSGSRHDTLQNLCIFNVQVQFNATTTISCGSQYPNAVYNSTTQTCSFIPGTKIVCIQGFNYNNSTSKCEKEGGYENVPIWGNLSSIPSWIFWAIGAAVALFLLFSLGRKR